MGDDAIRAFDAITEVKKNPIPREALPTGAIGRLGVTAGLVEEITAVKDLPIPRNALRTGAIERLGATAGVIEDNRPTVAMPALDGVTPNRGAGDADTDVRDSTPRSRGWLYVSLFGSLACLCVTAGAVLWAHDEVRRARAGEAAMQRELAGMNNVTSLARTGDAPPPADDAPQPAADVPVVAALDPRTCSLRVTASVPGATVWVDGMPHGEAPVVLAVECQPQSVEVRHPRYEVFERTLSPDGVVDIDARLERKKRRSRQAHR